MFFSGLNLSPHCAKRKDPNCLEELLKVQGMNGWEAHVCFQVVRGWTTLPGGRQGTASSGCCQDLAGEVSHHCPHEEDTKKGHVAAGPRVTPGYSPGAGEKMKCNS